MTKGAGSLISAAGHGAVLVCVVLILGEPKTFETPPSDAIAVELVTPKEVAAAEAKPEAEEAKPEAGKPAPAPESRPSEAQQQRQEQPPAAKAETPPQPGAPQQAAAPSAEPPHPVHALFGPSLPQPGTLDTSELLALYNMRTPGFDAPADTKAKLSAEEVARFKAHLRRCWQLPAGLAGSATRVVLRLSLNPDGTLAAEPMLIEASAANDGPQVMRAAMAAVERCQPFAFLPRERYGEWKELDVGFSPREMGGGQGG
jgi:hypothetical protein